MPAVAGQARLSGAVAALQPPRGRQPGRTGIAGSRRNGVENRDAAGLGIHAEIDRQLGQPGLGREQEQLPSARGQPCGGAPRRQLGDPARRSTGPGRKLVRARPRIGSPPRSGPRPDRAGPGTGMPRCPATGTRRRRPYRRPASAGRLGTARRPSPCSPRRAPPCGEPSSPLPMPRTRSGLPGSRRQQADGGWRCRGSRRRSARCRHASRPAPWTLRSPGRRPPARGPPGASTIRS